jgi:hypothetical protein
MVRPEVWIRVVPAGTPVLLAFGQPVGGREVGRGVVLGGGVDEAEVVGGLVGVDE